MRSLLKRANCNTCSSESQDISVELIGSLVQHSCLIRHICGYFINYPFKYSATLGRCAIKSPIPSFPESIGTTLQRAEAVISLFCAVKWGVECLFKLVVGCSEALSDRWHDSLDPLDGRCDLSTVSSKRSTNSEPVMKLPSDNPWLSSNQFIIHSVAEAWFAASNRYASVAF